MYKPNQVHLHDKVRYEPDQEYDIPEGLAMYFVLNGWGSDDRVKRDPEPQPSAVDIQPDNLTQNQES